MEKNSTKKLRYVILPDGRRLDKLTDAFRPGRIISIVGGGGKTSTMAVLGEELACQGFSAIMTTTTKIKKFDRKFVPGLRCIGREAGNGKLEGVPDPDSLIRQCDHLIIEADGSRGLPVKMPAAHEPVISPASDMVIALVGLSGIGRPIGEVCHRPEIVCEFLGKNQNDLVSPEDAARIIESPKGLMKNVNGRNFLVIFNQADSDREIETAHKIGQYLPETIPYLITAYENEVS